jgi:hypothetical protein
MATRIIHTLVDDIDRSTDNVGTYRFALQGVDYEIDLSEANFDTLCAALNPFITAGRRQPRKTGADAAGRAGATGRRNPDDVRAWWAQNAAALNLPAYPGQGPIPPAVAAAYKTAR